MIVATADQITKVVVNDPALLRTLHDFLDQITGDADDIDAILGELSATVAARSPFADHVALENVVRAELLSTLHRTALRRLPVRGPA
jgi:hypothetical protein